MHLTVRPVPLGNPVLLNPAGDNVEPEGDIGEIVKYRILIKCQISSW